MEGSEDKVKIEWRLGEVRVDSLVHLRYRASYVLERESGLGHR